MRIQFNLIKKILLSITLILTFFLGNISSAIAEYPDRPISVVVAYNPGGATDFQARLVTMMAAHPKKDYLGQPIVIINKPGAGGKVGWNWFASKARNDGYDLAAYNVPHFISQSIVFDDTEYNIDNLEPIANWGADPAVLIVGKDSDFNTLDDLMSYAKSNPGKVTFSGAGKFVGHHIAFLQFQKASGLELTYVPHTGGVPALTAVKGGQVMAGVNNLSDAYRSQNDIKILALSPRFPHEEEFDKIVYATCNPPFDPLEFSEKTEIVYHACEWDRNFFNKDMSENLKAFLSSERENIEFCFMEEMLYWAAQIRYCFLFIKSLLNHRAKLPC